HRIHVLDVADDDHVVIIIAKELELIFLPSEYRLLDEHLVDRAEFESAQHFTLKLILVPDDAAPHAAKCERRTNDDRQSAELLDNLFRVEQRLSRAAAALTNTNVVHEVAKLRAVFGNFDGVDVDPDHMDALVRPVALVVEV